jgi:hypothetical protein
MRKAGLPRFLHGKLLRKAGLETPIFDVTIPDTERLAARSFIISDRINAGGGLQERWPPYANRAVWNTASSPFRTG